MASAALVVWMFATGQRAVLVPSRWLRISALCAVYVGLLLAFLFVPGLGSLAIKLVALAGLLLAMPVIGIVSPQLILQVVRAVRGRLARVLANPVE